MSDVEIVIGVRGDLSGGQQVKASLDQIVASGDKAISSVGKLDAAYKSANNSAKQLFSPQSGLAQFAAAAKQGEQAAHGLQLATAGATREFIVMAHEVLTGNFSRIPGSLLVLGERMGGLHDVIDKVKGVFTVTNVAIAASVAVMTALAIHINEVEKELNQINVAFKATGQGAIFNRDQIEGYIEQLSALSGISRKDAVAAQEELAKSFGLTSDRLIQLEGILPDIAAGLGVDLPHAAKMLAEGMNDPAKALEELDKRFNLLTPDQLLMLQQMKDINDKAGEQNMLLAALTDRFKGFHNDGLSPVEAALERLSQGFERANANIAIFLKNAQNSLVQKMMNATIGIGNAIGNDTSGITQAMADAKSASAIAQYDALAAQDLSDDNQKMKDAIQLAQTLNGYTDQRQKMTGNIDTLQQAYNDAVASGDTQEAQFLQGALSDANQQLAEIDRRHKEQAYQLSKDIDAEHALREATKQARLEQEALRKEVDGPTGRAFKKLVETVDNDLQDAFKRAFEHGTGGWKDMLDGFKKTFEDFLAEMAYMAIAQPIIVPVLSAVGGSMGLSSAAVGSILGSQGAGSSLGGMSGLSNLGLLSHLLPSSTTGGIFNSIGKSLGFGFDTAGGGFTPGSIFGASTIGNTFLGGSIGGLAANLLGLGSSNQLVNMGTGTAGALIGQALIPIPVFGAAIGSFACTALGGLFGGNDKQYPYAASALATVNGTNKIAYTNTLDGGNTKPIVQAAQGLLSTMDQITAALGAKSYALDKVFAIGTNSGRGNLGTGYFGGSGGGYFAANQQYTGLKSLQDAVNKTLASMLADATFQGLDPQLQAVIKQVAAKGGSPTDILNNVQFAKSYLDGSLLGTQDPLKAALDALNAQFDTMKQTATDLGLSLDPLNKAYEDQKKAIEDSVQAQKAGFSSMESMTQAFKNFLDGEALGSDSSLSPMGKLSLAQGNFNTLLSQAQGGDLSHVSDLLTAGNTLLDQGRGVYASSTDYAQLESFVRTSITAIAHAAGVPGYASGTLSARSGWARVGEDGPELIRFRGGEQVYSASQAKNMDSGDTRELARQLMIISSKLDGLEGIKRETIKTRKVHERSVNKLAAAARA